MDFIVSIIWQVICYKVGIFFMKIITGGRFKDEKGAYWVSLVGAVVIAVPLVLLSFLRME